MARNPPFEPVASIESAVAEVAARFSDIAALWIYGSVARGESRVDSDLDVAILLREDESGTPRHRMLGELAAQLEQATRRAIDLIVLGDQGPLFKHRVLREGRCVYCADEDRRVDFESDVSVEYLDFRPTYDIAARASLEGYEHWLEGRK